jgi:primosomal protein N' (replication factor Y) (superfamily II helicase)
MYTLTTVQKNALQIIRENKYILLHGITGSGKTEVYISAAEEAIAQGQQVIVLVPEISLTPQTISRFTARIPKTISIHSHLTPKERREAWAQIIAGDIDLIIGARSAVFAPVRNLGLIIVDEEHDASYKQDNNPRYHTVAVALKRAELTAAKVILGSATPALETYYAFTHTPGYSIASLPKRVTVNSIPTVTLVDMREEIKEKNYSVLSRTLRDHIQRRLEHKEKVMLFLNRRGFATFINCRACGHVLTCERCQVSLTYHQDDSARCHYCNAKIAVPKTCPKCNSPFLKFFGNGTQRVEAEIQKYFGYAPLFRMDKDTTQKRGSHNSILQEFQAAETGILIGTQMIAKGHDFPDVTLVGILAADATLHIPDFRAAERTFQLLTQVAGRAGRGNIPGEVIIQTYSPEHTSILAAAAQDYPLFYAQEMEHRQLTGYPPFTKLTAITFSSPDEQLVEKRIKEIAARYPQEKRLGPAPCPINKIRGFYRWQFLLKDTVLDYAAFDQNSDVKIDIDVDPVNLY